MADVDKIIATINPGKYYDGDAKDVKKLDAETTADEIIKEVKDKTGSFKAKSEVEHKLIYDSSTETLEPIYFFILDLMNDFGYAPEKLVDNFTSTPGGAHFSETGMKAVRMQEEAMKIMGGISTVTRTVLQIVYDLKEFQIRLKSYDNLKSKNKEVSEGALSSLKQIWMDKVDMQKGNSSIKAMALGQAGFQTLLDAFLVSKDEESADKLDLNDRVKRIVKQRVQEFNVWLKESEQELRKRYEIQRNYLKSQVATLKLYSRWAKPYLKAAEQLTMKERSKDASLVNMFNTIRFDLTLLGKSKIKVADEAAAGNLPYDLEKIYKKTKKRDYYSCILVDFKFRAIPRQGAMTGRSEISFKAYALNQDEIDRLEKELDKSDLGDALKLIEGATQESLDQMQKEIEMFLKEEKAEEEIKEKEKQNDVNPFKALIGKADETKKQEKEDKKADKKIKSEDFIEKEHIRPFAAETASEMAFKFFDIYKKAHGMPSYV